MRSLMELQFPRMVHGPSGASQRVDSRADCAEALAQGWCLTPVLTPVQEVAVYAAKLAAGEVDAEPSLEPFDVLLAAQPFSGTLAGDDVTNADYSGPIIGHKKRGRPRKV